MDILNLEQGLNHLITDWFGSRFQMNLCLETKWCTLVYIIECNNYKHPIQTGFSTSRWQCEMLLQNKGIYKLTQATYNSFTRIWFQMNSSDILDSSMRRIQPTTLEHDRCIDFEIQWTFKDHANPNTQDWEFGTTSSLISVEMTINWWALILVNSCTPTNCYISAIKRLMRCMKGVLAKISSMANSRPLTTM